MCSSENNTDQWQREREDTNPSIYLPGFCSTHSIGSERKLIQKCNYTFVLIGSSEFSTVLCWNTAMAGAGSQTRAICRANDIVNSNELHPHSFSSIARKSWAHCYTYYISTRDDCILLKSAFIALGAAPY